MSESKRVSTPWVDPDDAPDLSDMDPAKGVWSVGGHVVTPEEGMASMAAASRRGRPKAEHHKEPVTLRVDAEVLARWRASGKGWQTRAAQALAKMAPEAA